jgi:hypothetical protein
MSERVNYLIGNEKILEVNLSKEKIKVKKCSKRYNKKVYRRKRGRSKDTL